MRMLLLGRRVSLSSRSRTPATRPVVAAASTSGAKRARTIMSGPDDGDAASAAAAAIARLAGRPPPQLSPDLWRLLADSHAHPQLADYGTGEENEENDEENPASAFSAAAARATARQTLARASAARIACMSVGAGVDWARVEALAELDSGGGRIIPAFGIHPWWAHLHGSSNGGGEEGTEGEGGGGSGGAATGEAEPMRSLLEVPDEAEMQAALQSVARAAAEGRLGLYGGGGGGDDDEANDAPATAALNDNPLPPIAPIPRRVWEPRLRSLLEKYPSAIVGEAGLDRAAVIPGTKKARCAPKHQLALLQAQLSVAADLGRPISLHCVRAHGALYEELRARASAAPGPAGLPPAVMLHSFGGPPEEAARFAALERLSASGGNNRGAPRCRIFFSFSAVINQRTDPLKLAARIRAVPEDRLLLESDEVAPPALDGALARSLALVAAARGWSLEEAAGRCRANFDAFYSLGDGGDGHL